MKRAGRNRIKKRELVGHRLADLPGGLWEVRGAGGLPYSGGRLFRLRRVFEKKKGDARGIGNPLRGDEKKNALLVV